MAYTFSWVPTPGQNNSFVTNNNGTARAILDSTQNSFISNPYNSPLYICISSPGFKGGNASAATLYDFAKFLATNSFSYTTVQQPAINYDGSRVAGGTFTLNRNQCGSYEYNILPTTTLTQSMVATLFSSALDISSWIIVKGDLTLASGVTLIPNVNVTYPPNSVYATAPDGNALRRLFMVVYVTGNLTVPSDAYISMSACGGNSDTTGANISTVPIPVASSLYGGLSPSISALGADGGAAGGGVTTGVAGSNGSLSSNTFTTGGGGSGWFNTVSGTASTVPGRGGRGSAFSGGTGGGNTNKSGTSTDGSSLGGQGGTSSSGSASTGGTGNPGGTGTGTSYSGTGGILIVIVEGTTSTDTASFAANGVSATSGNSGGASGGGIIIQLYTGTFAPTTLYKALGGTATAPNASGGAGSYGTYRIS